MADKKISELVSITGSATAADDYFVVVDTSGAVTHKISREELNNAIEQDVLSSIEITDITNDVNVQGTVTADGLTVDDGGSNTNIRLQNTNSGSGSTDGFLIQHATNAHTYVWNYENADTVFGTNATERMRIESDGDIALGNAGSNNYSWIRPYQATTGNMIIDADKGATGSGGSAIIFQTRGAEKMVIQNSGNVGIGTSSPGGRLVVADPGTAVPTAGYGTGLMVARADGLIGLAIGDIGSGNASYLQAKNFTNTDTKPIALNPSGGNVGIGTSAPSSKLSVVSGTNAGITVNDGTVNTILFNTSSANGSLGTTTNHPMAFYANNAEHMRITSAGNVGIGTSSPGRQLHVKSSNATVMQVESTNASIAQMTFVSDGAASNPAIGAVDDTAFNIQTGNSERMRIDSSGNLLVGTTSSGSFSISAGVITSQSGRVLGTCSNDSVIVGSRLGSDGPVASWYRNTAFVGSISVTASSTAYNTSSDYRLKTAVNYDWDATTRLKQLKPARFEWIADGDDAVPVDGFLAHEVEDIVPESITGTKDAMRDEEYEVTPAVLDEDGNEVTPAVMGTRSVPDYQGIDQSKLVPLLVKTIQELEARIAALEAN